MKVLLNKGYYEFSHNDYPESVRLGRLLLQRSYDSNDLEYEAEALYLLAINDEAVEEYARAKEKYNKVIEIAEKLRDTLFVIDVYNGLGNIAAVYDNDHQKSREYYLKALELSDKINNTDRITFIINLCWEYLDAKEYKEVPAYLKDLQQYLDGNKTVTDPSDAGDKCHVFYILGRYYAGIKEFDKGSDYLDKAVAIAKEFDLDEEEADAYKARAELYIGLNRPDKAYKALEDYISAYKKNSKLAMLNKMQIEEVKYKLQEYERTLEVAEKEKKLADSVAASKSKLNTVYLVVSFLLLLSLVFIYRENLSKKKLIKSLHKNNQELALAKKQASKAAEAKTNFVSNVSHELRTPLHGVIGITSLLLGEKEISEKNKRLLKSLKFSGDYLLSLINNVLLISKIDNNKIKIIPKPFKVSFFFENLKHSVEYSAVKKNVKLNFLIGKDVPKVIVLDENILSEVLINLMENAIKFSHNGNVSVGIEKIRNNEDTVVLRFTVLDDGIGIPEEQKKQIFQKFSQLIENQSIMEGAGLGLSIVKSLLEQMNSEIHLESKPNQGARFYFDVTTDLVADTKEVDIDDLQEKNVNFKGKKIILVEDNEINKLVLKKFLDCYEVQLEVFSDGDSGFESISSNKYDLALLDINIPGLNGYEITERVRKFDKELPIVAVTASELTEIEDFAFEAGMNDILIKPFNKSKLLEILNKYLS
ncbi:tetratricopeptide repeat-containing hybrid sensor histidine kinase/response regulator [Neptunitalea chrysea]|uniref:tetratricopeptide repeat-containing hybrid sensor histidine kinase/response regulator n=1 Tax=Neptunitalea chrysea TaxID=1647581 RepID=UPI00248F62DD|nr:ATP-binding protein [Neptunitalea chrysea]